MNPSVIRIFLGAWLALVSFPLMAASSPSKPSLNSQMDRIYASLATILPLAYDTKKFGALENSKLISNSLAELESVSHELDMKNRNVPLDPFNRMISRGLKSDLKTARQLFMKGEANLSRDLVRGLTGYCIGCHTSTSRGAWNFPGVDIAAIKDLSPIDKATYLAAVRQYDESIIYFENALIDLGKVRQSPEISLNWELAVKRMLAIIVRVQDNPFLALELVSRIREEGSVPEGLRISSAQWRRSIKEWAEERSKPDKKRTPPLTLARALVSAGEKISGELGPDAGLIPYLRASRIVNELLRNKQTGADTGELLWLGGQIAEKTDTINFWTLDLGYYEACIRFQPKSILSKKCFDRLKLKLGSERVGSSEATKARFNELKALSGA